MTGPDDRLTFRANPGLAAAAAAIGAPARSTLIPTGTAGLQLPGASFSRRLSPGVNNLSPPVKAAGAPACNFAIVARTGRG